MSSILECDYERTVRVEAALEALYGEMDSVERLLRFMPQIDGHEPDPASPAEIVHGHVGLGPLSCRVTGTMLVERVDPPRSLAVHLRAPGPRLDLTGIFEFASVSSEQTALRYAATIRSTHPLIRRMRSSLIGLLEEHVDEATQLAAVRGRQYTHAAEVFSPDSATQPDST